MPKIDIFISYSHESKNHADWVRNLAEKLVHSGISVIFDQWHLLPGDDVAHFMEKGLEKAKYVLLICTPIYAHKFNNRKAGVSHEADLILGEIMTSDSRSHNVIPLLRTGMPSDAIPRYLKTKLFIDFRIENESDNSFDQLLRRLNNTPKYSPPEMGDFQELKAVKKTVAQSPKSWVLVAGTGSGDLSEKIQNTVKSLATFLAGQEYGLITGGWAGVDELVARIYARELIAQGNVLEDFLTQVVNENGLPSFPAGNMLLVKQGKEEWTEGIKLADAVILIGGVGGTWETGNFGLEYKKAVFPLADTGGDSAEFYKHMLKNWNEIFFTQIDKKNFQKLGREAPGVVENLGFLLELI